MSEVTRSPLETQEINTKASEELLPLVYEELRRLASQKMASEAAGHTLQPTALVHEAWLRLTDGRSQPWHNRGHFFAAAAEAMRRILIERARAKNRVRRGGEWHRVDMEHVTVAVEDPDETMLAIHDALEKLTAQDPLKADIVKLRYFVGLNHSEIAQALGLAESTIRRHWAFARSWLHAELSPSS